MSYPAPQPSPIRNAFFYFIAIAVPLGLFLVVAPKRLAQNRAPVSVDTVATAQPVQPPPVAPPKADDIESRLKDAIAYASENPDDKDGAIKRLKRVRGEAEEIAKTADRELAKLEPKLKKTKKIEKHAAQAGEAVAAQPEQPLEKGAGVDEVMAKLNAQARELVTDGKIAKAIALYDNYDGPMMGETLSARMTASAALEKQKVAAKMEQNTLALRAKSEAYTKAARAVLSGRTEAALAGLEKMIESPNFAAIRDDMQSLSGQLEVIESLDQTVIGSFKADAGKQISIKLASGPGTFVVGPVDAEWTSVSLKGKNGAFEADGGDIHVDEKIARLEKSAGPNKYLLCGVAAAKAGMKKEAALYFKLARTPLAQAFMDVLAAPAE
jgi:hypothetical protein